MSRPLPVFAAMALALVSVARGAELRVEVAPSWNNNVGLATESEDAYRATRYTACASGGIWRDWGQGVLTSVEAHTIATRTPRFPQSDRVELGIDGATRKKFGLGPFAPAVAVDVGLLHRDARTDGNDGWESRLGTSLSRRLSPAWRVSTGLDWTRHRAKLPAYQDGNRRWHSEVRWDATPNLQIAAGAGRLWGNMAVGASDTVWKRETAQNRNYYKAYPNAVTHEFGYRWWTYLVPGQANFGWVETTPAVGPHTAISCRFEYRDGAGDRGDHYRQSIWTLRLIHRF
jgi:hypothetical protein